MEDPRDCSICFDRYTDPVILKCGHTFDRECVKSKSICPLCREPIEIWATNWQMLELMERYPPDPMIPLDDPKYLMISNPLRCYYKASWANLKPGQYVAYTLTFVREKKIFKGWVHYIDVPSNQLEIKLTNQKIVTVCPEFIDEIWYHRETPMSKSNKSPGCDTCTII